MLSATMTFCVRVIFVVKTLSYGIRVISSASFRGAGVAREPGIQSNTKATLDSVSRLVA